MDIYEIYDFTSFYVSYALIIVNLVLSVFSYQTNVPKKTKTGLV